MATLTIRNVPEEVRERLRLRAAQAGRSMEAEVRAILEAATLEEEARLAAGALQDWVAELYGGRPPRGAADELIAERRCAARREAGGA